jgi:CheY-like chemotaxis protein
MTILIIEDDAVGAQMFGEYLRQAGYAVLWAEDGPGGIAGVEHARPDGVLLDVMLPGGMGGPAVLAELRTRYPKLPIVVYTNGFVPALVDEMTAAGATTVFNKGTLTKLELAQAFDRVLKYGEAA